MGATRGVLLLAAGVLLAGCTAGPPESDSRPSPSETSPSPTASDPPPPEFNVGRVRDDIRYLARRIGPRHATSAAYAEAADWVERRFTDLGYEVRRQEVDVPAGVSWGVRVRAGRATNVIASPPGFDDHAPHRIIGAHLDTVPRSPGAEDNASGVAVLLELARIHSGSDRPVRFIAFAAEEPRGLGDNQSHYGSRAYVRRLDDSQREAMKGMISLDRVGVGRVVTLSTGGGRPSKVRRQLVAIAKRADVPREVYSNDRASDHWSFERRGMPAARVGSVPYCCYHSPTDVPGIIRPKQLSRMGTVLTAWLR